MRGYYFLTHKKSCCFFRLAAVVVAEVADVVDVVEVVARAEEQEEDGKHIERQCG
jgi:hypothetical protein